MTERFGARAAGWAVALHDEATAFFQALDSTPFREDRWERPGGGGGVTRVLDGGATFEKVGVNRSVVEGVLASGLGDRIGARAPADGTRFFAAGVSVVAHPRSPMVPTVHFNVRYFELLAPDGGVADAWFGGGADLTPTYPRPDDARHFHLTLRALCARHRPDFYPRFKAWCDDYFVNAHRGGERRGVGGLFFDHLRPGAADALPLDALIAFVTDVGRALPAAYGPIVDRGRALPYGARARAFQLARRGRYVEFNLVHDRGTLFGLQTGARMESVLMSLPPLAAWPYAPSYPAGSFEAALLEMLEPRDWTA